MGTAVAVVKMNTPVAYVDPKKRNKDAGSRYLSRISGPKTPFAGTQIRFNGQDGEYQIGYGDGSKKHDEISLVVNVPQTLSAWQYWPADEAPTYPYITPVFAEGALPSREECGPEETKPNKLKKTEEDVWSEVTVAIMRSAKKADLYHMVCERSKARALAKFLIEANDAPELDKGLLPVVALGTEKIKLKDGTSYYGMTFEITDWVKATAADLPTALAEATPEEEPEEQDENPVAKAKGGKPTASAKPPRDEEPEEDEDDNETEEDDEKPVVRSRNGKDTARAKTFEQSEDEEQEEQEERPAKSKAKAKDDDGDVVKTGLRKRRAAL